MNRVTAIVEANRAARKIWARRLGVKVKEAALNPDGTKLASTKTPAEDDDDVADVDATDEAEAKAESESESES